MLERGESPDECQVAGDWGRNWGPALELALALILVVVAIAAAAASAAAVWPDWSGRV